jgi:hypothetical protein
VKDPDHGTPDSMSVFEWLSSGAFAFEGGAIVIGPACVNKPNCAYTLSAKSSSRDSGKQRLNM